MVVLYDFTVELQVCLQDERYGLLCILPNEKTGLAETERRLFVSGTTPAMLLANMFHDRVKLTLPKFKIEWETELSDTLKEVCISPFTFFIFTVH